MTRIPYLIRVQSTYWFRRSVPPELRGLIIGQRGKAITEWRYSLGVKALEEAKRLLPAHVAHSNDAIDRARAQLTGGAVPKADPAVAFNPDAERRAQDAVDEMERLSLEWADMAADAAAEQEARAEADPMFAAQLALRGAAAKLDRDREDLRLARDLRAEAAKAAQIDIMTLFDRYAAQPGRSPRTIAQWRVYLEKLVAFTGLTDASRLTPQHIRDWRNHLRDEATHRGKRLSAKTINHSYLASVRVVLGWGADDGLIPSNPAAGVKPVQLPKVTELRSRVLEDDEAKVILSASLAGKQGREADHFTDAKRWVPWLLCYSGARVNEVTQLRKEDVQITGGVPVMLITPDAGTVKTKEARRVPLHSDLIAQGFLAFVAASPDGPLFYDPAKRRKAGALNSQARKQGTKLAEWVRSLGVTVPQPNHAWRHRFVTLAQRHEMSERASMAIVGHSPGKQHQRYGDNELPVLVRELEKIPAFKLTAP
ncbi:MAG: DUF6538 domain-containing protein [Sphingopyxis sp.]|nr:DUF6538 domain-containing protein [Sphingopyxis sp.]